MDETKLNTGSWLGPAGPPGSSLARKGDRPDRPSTLRRQRGFYTYIPVKGGT